MFVFLGASLSAAAFQILGTDFFQIPNQLQNQQYTVQYLSNSLLTQTNQTLHEQTQKQLGDAQQLFAIYAARLILFPVLLFIIPIVISLVLTRVHPDKRIVPPLYMQIIVFAYYLLYALFHGQPSEIQQSISILMLVFVYTIMIPQLQDRIVLWVTGYTAHSEDMISYSFRARTRLERIEEVLTKDPFKTQLRILATPEDTNRGVELKTPKFSRFMTVIELEKNPRNDDETFINVVFFEKGQYYFKDSESIKEKAIDKIEYLKNVLERPEHMIKFEEINNSHAEHVKNSILDDTRGVYQHLGVVTNEGKFKIALFCIAIGIACGFFFIIKDNTNGFITLTIIILYVVFELPRRLIEKRRKK